VEYFRSPLKPAMVRQNSWHNCAPRCPNRRFSFPMRRSRTLPRQPGSPNSCVNKLVRKTMQGASALHSLSVSEFEWPHVTVEILVERGESKGNGHWQGGQLLKDVALRPEARLPEGSTSNFRVKSNRAGRNARRLRPIRILTPRDLPSGVACRRSVVTGKVRARTRALRPCCACGASGATS